MLRLDIFMESFRKKGKRVYKCRVCVYNNNTIEYGDAPDSIAGERKDKHTADGVPSQKHST